MSLSFDSPENMPPGMRKLYEQKMAGQKHSDTRARLEKIIQQESSKPNKYRNQPLDVELDNGDIVHFDSQKEAKRFSELSLLQDMNIIKNLRRQVPYELVPKQKAAGYTERPVIYVADFVYEQNGETVVEDTKSAATAKNPVFVIKRKLMLWRYGIQIKLT